MLLLVILIVVRVVRLIKRNNKRKDMQFVLLNSIEYKINSEACSPMVYNEHSHNMRIRTINDAQKMKVTERSMFMSHLS